MEFIRGKYSHLPSVLKTGLELLKRSVAKKMRWSCHMAVLLVPG